MLIAYNQVVKMQYYFIRVQVYCMVVLYDISSRVCIRLVIERLLTLLVQLQASISDVVILGVTVQHQNFFFQNPSARFGKHDLN